MNAGFILLYRQITEWEWYQNPNTFRVFLHCLLMANFTDGRFEGKDIRRGQFVTSLPSLAKQTKLTIQQVRTALDHLKSTGEITDSSTSKYRIITIVKYDQYQCDNRQNNRQSTDNQQAGNRQPTGNQQQYKNDNNGKTVDGDINNIFLLPDGEVERTIREDQEIEEAALNVGLTVSPAAMDTAKDLAFRYGFQNLLDAIKASIDVPKWSYVEGILRNGKRAEKEEERERESDFQEHRQVMKQYLINIGKWDDEYQCETEKAKAFRERGLTPDEARDEMEEEHERRLRSFEKYAKGRNRA